VTSETGARCQDNMTENHFSPYPRLRKKLTNKTENHFSPYPRLRKKLAINCGRTLNTLHLLNSEAINYGGIGLHKNN
jgi:hypothetical protein